MHLFDPFAPEPDAGHYPDLVLCPHCRRDVPAGPRWVTWCEGCGWNALVGAPEPATSGPSWASRWTARVRVRAARRVHAELLAGGGTGSPWPRRAAVAVAVVVLALTVVQVGLVLLWVVRGSGFWHWPLAVLLVLLLAAVLRGLVPPSLERGRGAGPDELSPDDAPALHALVRDVADLVGVVPPRRLRLSTQDNAWVSRELYGRHVDLTLGLVLWGRLSWDARLALLGHELGHCLPRGGGHRAVHAAGLVLRGWLRVLWPSGYDVAVMRYRSRWDRSGGLIGGPVLVWLATVLQRLAAVPALLALVLLDRLEASASQRAEYAADVAAARVAGTPGAVALLSGLVDPRGWLTSVSSALRRDEDVWTALAVAGRRPARETARLRRIARDETVRVDASHPPTALRIDLLERLPRTGPAATMTPERLAAVDREVEGLLRTRRRALTDRLLESWV
ncbi:M48 family metallopeptidase [Lapillicoccus jejuensis]|uniref:M48 family metallopeptidase n=1 Tax=Lapillicoccus jejuensis TaxID=402171 RepID=UPI001151B6AB|nr:M48 family metallopeptidase [Lapillicoccus jejuensis]